MNLIFLFRRLVYAQVLLGIMAFCMAERNPGLLLIAGTLGALSWYIVEGPTGRPLPQWMILLGAFASVVWLLTDLVFQQGEVIIAMGHFTMWLQVLLLYGRKSNREYGEILVLSLLQMIGASVLSVSMIYGGLLVAYCVLALFTILFFHLKTTSDLVLEANQAAAPAGMEVSRPKTVVGRGHRWHFRAVTLGVGAACSAMAVVVFLLMPRSGISRISPYLLSLPETEQVGFSETVALDGSAPISTSRSQVMQVVVRVNGQPTSEDEEGWLLRGAVLDHYDALLRTWTRTLSGETVLSLAREGQELTPMPPDQPMLEAQITLRNLGQRCLFAFAPVVWIQIPDQTSALFYRKDQQLAVPPDFTGGTLRYKVRSTLPTPLAQQPLSDRPGDGEEANYARGWSAEEDLVRGLARQILAERSMVRDPQADPQPGDLAIAQALEDYLRAHYTYSLVSRKPSIRDPIAVFLLGKSKTGHCEYFASSLTALARSLGLRARVVTGYRVCEFNRFGGYYVVRQSHAHAWSEVDGGPAGWRTFDPTPPAALTPESRAARGWLTGLRERYDHFEFLWTNTVVAYNQYSRQKLLANVNQSIEGVTQAQKNWFASLLSRLTERFKAWEFDELSLMLLGVILLAILAGLVSLIRILVVRHRRLVALQIMALPRGKRRGLVKQLRFYLAMLDLLERHGHVRPAWQSPFGFAQDLAAAQPGRFDAVLALTEMFYEIRFGYRQITAERSKWIDAQLAQLSASLARKAAS